LIFGKKYLKKKGGKNEGKKERRKRNEEHYKQQQFHRLTLRLKQRKIKITKETTPHQPTQLRLSPPSLPLNFGLRQTIFILTY
jgi:hypothetical protein